jgi:hypothetical protein
VKVRAAMAGSTRAEASGDALTPINSLKLNHRTPHSESPSQATHIVHLPDTRPSAKRRSFVDFVVARLG